MKTLLRITLICILLVSLVACTQKDDIVTKDNSLIKGEITSEDILSGLSDQEKSWMNITQEQYTEDFDWLYSQMQKNYPYFNVVSRKIGFNIDKEYMEYRKKIEICPNDVDFVATVGKFIYQMDYIGHLSLWEDCYMSEVDDKKSLISQFPQYKEHLTPYIVALDNPTSQRNYQAMQSFYENIDLQVEKANEGLLTDTTAEPADSSNVEPINLETKILQDGQIAYVKINSFDMNSYTSDKEILLPFYNSILDYKNIIIDITDNGGGGMDYFNDLVVAPLISKPATVSTYLLAKGGKNNRNFLQLDNGIAEGEWKPIKDLPALPKLKAEDLKDLDFFTQDECTVEPLKRQKNFKGKVWLLVGPNNYSSSEYAAMFSKYSGFATLVGEQTGGDGIGVDPAYIILPNSGLVVQYSPIYGITEDGVGSEEFGTTPDIASEKGKSALETCLKAIATKK